MNRLSIRHYYVIVTRYLKVIGKVTNTCAGAIFAIIFTEQFSRNVAIDFLLRSVFSLTRNFVFGTL